MVTVHAVRKLWHTNTVIFSVPIPGKPPVYMSVGVANSDQIRVVIVDADKFIKLWRQALPNRLDYVMAHGMPRTWRQDRKYPEADKGFSHGEENPVPLAFVSCLTHEVTDSGGQGMPFVMVSNITRTIWLLAQGCRAFPVECRMPGAEILHRLASVSGAEMYSINQLVSPNQQASPG